METISVLKKISVELSKTSSVFAKKSISMIKENHFSVNEAILRKCKVVLMVFGI